MASNGRVRAEKRSHAAALAPSLPANHTNGANKQPRLSRAQLSVATRTALTDISNRRQLQHGANGQQARKADDSVKERQHNDLTLKPATRSHSRPNDKENSHSHTASTQQPLQSLRRSSRSAVSSNPSSTNSALQQSYSLSDSTYSSSEYNNDSTLDDSYVPESSDDSAVYDQHEDGEDSLDQAHEDRQAALDVAVEKLHAGTARPISSAASDSELALQSSSSPQSFHARLPRSRFLNNAAQVIGAPAPPSVSASAASSSASTTSIKPTAASDYTRRVYEPVKPSTSEQSAALQRWQSAAHFKPDYSTSIFTHLLATERHSLPSPSYMDDVQGDLSYPMRAILLDWLVEVAEEYHLQPQTLWLCVAYVDRFLTLQPVDRSRLQLVGVACMLIAAKYWEIYPPTIEDFVYISDHTYDRQQVLSMERSVLQALRFQLTVPTAWEFSRRLHTLCRMSDQEGHLMDYLMEAFLQEKDLLEHTPSILATAAAYLALSTLSRPGPVSSLLSDVSGYEYRHVKDCVRAMWTLHVKLCGDKDGGIAAGTQGLKAVKDKYASAKWSEASKVRPRESIAEIK